MELRSNFAERVIVLPGDVEWTASPSGGVKRQMLDRVGGEVARATSIVQFEAGAEFAQHEHGGGEEFLVLEGVFSDETGDFPAGSYVRNPIGSKHTPHSAEGCTIFVKLHQFAQDDTEQKHIDTRAKAFLPGAVPGLSVLPLHSHGAENVALVRWAPGTHFNTHRHWGGEEILVLEGTFQDEHGDYPAGSWLRSPHMSQHTPFSDDGCLIYVKTGHLPD
ncbi:MAG: cupin domain-containing protein [Pseudomonadota bacterium]